MGFLSFLTRKTAGEKPSNLPANKQTYHVAVPAPRPARGTTPVSRTAGTGSTPVRPYFLGVKGDSTRRPDTAPFGDSVSQHSRPPSSSRSHRDSVRGPPSSSKSNSRRNTHLQPFDSETLSLPPPVPALSIHSNQDGSITSGKTSNGFVDLLDAQGAIRPSDFKSRVVAAGVRDYGEDVAERNIVQNGLGITLAAAPSAKSPSKRSPSRQAALRAKDVPTANRPLSAMSGTSNTLPSLTRTPPPCPSRIRSTSKKLGEVQAETTGMAPHRTMSLNSAASLAYHGEHASSSKPRRVTSKAYANRTESPRRHHPTGREPPQISRPRSPPHMLTLTSQPAGRRADNRSASPPAIRRYRARDEPQLDWAGDEEEDAEAVAEEIRNESRPVWDTFGRGIASRRSVQSLFNPDPATRHITRQQHISYVRKIPSILGMVDDGVAGIVDDSSDDGSFNDPASSPPSRNYVPSSKHHTQLRPHTQDGGSDLQSGHTGGDRPHSASRSTGGPRSHPRTRSMSSMSGFTIPRLDEIAEHAPVRTWSISSTAPTTISSEHSGAVFASSRSYHTANTSIDLSVIQPTKPGYDCDAASSIHSQVRPSSSSYYTPDEDCFSADTTVAPRRSLSVTETVKDEEQRSPDFNMDNFDAVTTDPSDIDSFIERRLRTDSDTESLTVNDNGCIDLGRGLPGLFDCIDSPDSPVEAEMPQTPTGPPATAVSESFSDDEVDILSKPLTRRERLRALGYDYDSEDSEPEFDVDVSRDRAMAKLPVVCEASPSGSMGNLRGRGVEQVEDNELVQEALRVRKVSKKQQRMDMRQRSLQKLVGGDADDGNLADVE